jgi:hypothetical protein
MALYGVLHCALFGGAIGSLPVAPLMVGLQCGWSVIDWEGVVASMSKKRNWAYAAGSFVTFLLIAFSGRRLIDSEPLRTLWILIAGLLSLAIWLLVRHIVDRRS